jgi:multidrug resistance efflux pump
MSNKLSLSFQASNKRRVALCACALFALVASSACRSAGSGSQPDTRGIIIVNAPAAGEVRRVLVREGMSVSEGTPIVEIAVLTAAKQTPQAQAEDPVARAGRNIKTAESAIEAARAEVVRTEVEVQRLTPLVASGGASSAELEGARALYDRAQQRFQQVQASAKNAQADLVAARQPSRDSTTAAPSTSEQLVTARASSAGTVTVINTRVGDRVTSGQPLATLRAD